MPSLINIFLIVFLCGVSFTNCNEECIRYEFHENDYMNLPKSEVLFNACIKKDGRIVDYSADFIKSTIPLKINVTFFCCVDKNCSSDLDCAFNFNCKYGRCVIVNCELSDKSEIVLKEDEECFINEDCQFMVPYDKNDWRCMKNSTCFKSNCYNETKYCKRCPTGFYGNFPQTTVRPRPPSTERTRTTPHPTSTSSTPITTTGAVSSTSAASRITTARSTSSGGTATTLTRTSPTTAGTSTNYTPRNYITTFKPITTTTTLRPTSNTRNVYSYSTNSLRSSFSTVALPARPTAPSVPNETNETNSIDKPEYLESEVANEEDDDTGLNTVASVTHERARPTLPTVRENIVPTL